MAKKIEVGERVRGWWDTAFGSSVVVGILRQRPTSPEDPYLVLLEEDIYPCYKIARVQKAKTARSSS